MYVIAVRKASYGACWVYVLEPTDYSNISVKEGYEDVVLGMLTLYGYSKKYAEEPIEYIDMVPTREEAAVILKEYSITMIPNVDAKGITKDTYLDLLEYRDRNLIGYEN